MGRNLIRQLLIDGKNEIYAVVRPDSKNLGLLPVSDHVHMVPLPLDRLEDPNAGLPKYCDAFYHFAWGGVNRKEIDDPNVQQANIVQALDCVRAAKALQCKVFVDAGSRAEYGFIDGPFREDAACDPITAYGKAKIDFCNQARELLKGSSTRLVHARIFSVYGPDDHPWSLVYTCVTKMLLGQPVELGPCTQLWNFMEVDDVCDLLIAFYEMHQRIPPDDNAVFNVATRDIRPLREFVEVIRTLTRSESELRFSTFQQEKGSTFSIQPDMGKVERIFGWEPKISFEEGIQRVIDEVRRK